MKLPHTAHAARRLARCGADSQTLKVHHFLPSTSNVHVNLIQPWCDKIAKESANR
jgi:hypothetical protein